MMGPTHRVLGAVAGASYASWIEHARPSLVLMTAAVATVSSSGPTSPDGDQADGWRLVTRVTPIWVRRHRGMLHWWGLPALAWLFAAPRFELETQWAVHALLIGWISHLVGDAIFGRVPLLPWGAYFGLGLDTGGFLENGRGRLPSPTRIVLGLGLVAIIGYSLTGGPA